MYIHTGEVTQSITNPAWVSHSRDERQARIVRRLSRDCAVVVWEKIKRKPTK